MLLALVTGGAVGTSAIPQAVAEAWSADDEIDLAKVPAKVRKAADKAVPKAVWTSASMSKEDGEVTYELEGTDASKRFVSVEVSSDGEVSEVQTEIPQKEVPAVVAAKLKSRFPRFVTSTVYEVREDGKVIRYDFEGKRPKDKEDIGIYISADGKDVELDAD